MGIFAMSGRVSTSKVIQMVGVCVLVGMAPGLLAVQIGTLALATALGMGTLIVTTLKILRLLS